MTTSRQPKPSRDETEDPRLRSRSNAVRSGVQSRANSRRSAGARRSAVEAGTLAEVWAGQVARTPDAVAVSTAGEAVSYGALDGRAARVAGWLQARGVGPETRVALLLPRTAALAVGIVGVVQAGGVYVPVEPELPAARRAQLLADAQPAWVLTTAATAAAVPAGFPSVTVEQAVAEGAVGGPSGLRPAHAAYVIYTSGSTGAPKGVVVTQANVARLFPAAVVDFEFGPDEVWALCHSYAFDFSVWEMWGAWRWGGRLVVVEGAVVRAPDELWEVLAREQVTVLNQTPSAFAALTATASAADSALALRWVVLGGEAVEFGRLARWWARHGAAPAVVNMYGITETTVHVTYLRAGRRWCGRGRRA